MLAIGDAVSPAGDRNPELLVRCHHNRMATCPAWCVCGAFTIRLLPLLLFLFSAAAHNSGPKAPCNRGEGLKLDAYFLPGTVTVDGRSDDWNEVAGQAFSLLPALTEDAGQEYAQGDGTVYIRVAHDGSLVYFLVEVTGAYAYAVGDAHGWPSVALMFGVGDDATYSSMGGCSELPCNSVSCAGHEVDIAHFELGRAIPGRLYGGNLAGNLNGTGMDSVGDLNDMYAFSPHCKAVDGAGVDGVKVPGTGGQNDWQGAWSHSSVEIEYGLVQGDSPFGTSGAEGKYVFEFARPLRTGDRLQQDVQFRIGGEHRFAIAFWYPVGGSAWQPAQHFSGSCDWIPLTLHPAAHKRGKVSGGVGFFLGLVATLLALVALAVSIVLGRWWFLSKERVKFTSLDPL